MSTFIMTVSTLVIAIFSYMSWRTSNEIKKMTQKKDEEIKEILIKMISSNLTTYPGQLNVNDLVESYNKIYKAIKNSNFSG